MQETEGGNEPELTDSTSIEDTQGLGESDEDVVEENEIDDQEEDKEEEHHGPGQVPTRKYANKRFVE